MKPEEKARENIDKLLKAAGWEVQDIRDLNLGAALGVAIREFPLKSGPVDYLLFVDRRAVGVVEAKPEGTTLSGVAEQSEKYIATGSENLPQVEEPLPFAYESTGVETFFRDSRDFDTRSRRVFAFHRPETLKEWLAQGETLRAHLRRMPPLLTGGLWNCQIEAITNLDKTFVESRPRAVIQMATGSGKTYTAVSFVYRLIKFANARRILFLVDRNNLGRQVLEYFDAFIIGLTATPSKQTLGFFNQNLVMEYSHDRAVADGVNVDYEVYRIRTRITEGGSTVEAGYYVDKRDKFTRRVRWEQLDEDLAYTPKQLDRDVVALDQIRTVIQTFRDKLFTELFPSRTGVPKTLIFAKTDSHAEDIVHIVREEFGKGNEFCKKITYKTTGEKPENLIASFRNSYNPRIAVTVDMISTGTDIKPIECILFMRDVKSRVYFEQMKGRGTRTISPTDLQAVSGDDALHKTHFVIVDAVGVCENDKTDSRPLERKKGVSFDKLIMSIALGNRDEDSITSLAGRLARLDRQLSGEDIKEIEKVTEGKPLKEIINELLDAVDPDKQIETAKEMFQTEEPTEQELTQASEALAKDACTIFDNPTVRNTLSEIKRKNEQIIDTVSKDTAIFAGFDTGAQEKARTIIDSFKTFIAENKDELTALQIIYSKPYGKRHLTYEEIKQLADVIKKPPYNLTSDLLWQAYEQLEKSKVRRAGPQKLLTDIISLVRFAIGDSELLEPFAETVNDRFEHWLSLQEKSGRTFTPEQIEWLKMIKDHVATSLSIEVDDFELAPFYEKGGAIKAYQLFGQELDKVLEELNEVLVV